MWLFFTRRLRMWLILTVLVPLTTGLLRRVGRGLERRNGPSRVSRALLRAGDLGDRARGRRSAADAAAAEHGPSDGLDVRTSWTTTRTGEEVENSCMTHPPAVPRSRATAARRRLRGMALFCHGGTATSVAPPRERPCRWCGCAPIEQFVRNSAGDRGIATHAAPLPGGRLERRGGGRLHRRPLGDRADARGARAASVPIVLVGHSMGGRAALRAGGDPQVAAVCGLAPWTPPG